eukprot:Gregarina_sp_Poly_1__746@NODE_117_length_13667_cov_177_395147_g104_i0_p6_GENE_NODE_117_length_13667_cov_177_395147_g104_i0NODE_117_length_13667_cov_177_395147_g104_i0_p6_ORF_typecomplete_len239_score4_81Epiglycanin_C/PF14654_6/0_27_NODE_117_length_13667_cov_177_395147_g104_i061126828
MGAVIIRWRLICWDDSPINWESTRVLDDCRALLKSVIFCRCWMLVRLRLKRRCSPMVVLKIVGVRWPTNKYSQRKTFHEMRLLRALFVLLFSATFIQAEDATVTAAALPDNADDDSMLWEEIVDRLQDAVGFADGAKGAALSSATCSRYNGRCRRCADQDMCSYCYATETCLENSEISSQTCSHPKGWIRSKLRCRGYLNWWGITLVVLACVCLCPLISFLCFVYVIKKICCGGGGEA